EGIDAMQPIPAARWNHEDYYDANPDAVGKIYTKKAAFLDQPVDAFDARFFGISPREAELMDPQQRLLLEVAWEALENGGIAPTSLNGSSTGVFIGMMTHDFENIVRNAQQDPSLSTAFVGSGTSLSAAAGRLSYFL